MFKIGIYKTREEAEKAARLWADVYDIEKMDIQWDSPNYILLLPSEEE